jgi:hypothetical protein
MLGKRIQQCATSQVSQDRSSKTLASWNNTSDPFFNWKEQLARTGVRKMDDGVSSTLEIRPALRGYGNAVVPQVAALFLRAVMDVIDA